MQMSKKPEIVIGLMRHADYLQPESVPSAMLPYALSPEGEVQAANAAREIESFAEARSLEILSVIDSSCMLRAYQTAKIVSECLANDDRPPFSVAEYDALAERSVGAVANLRVDEIEQLLRDDPRYDAAPVGWKSDRRYKLPFQGAESLMEAGLRVTAHIEKTLAELSGLAHPGLKIIVGHGASIRHAAVELGMLTAEDVGGFSMYHASPLFISRTESGWTRIAGDWKVRADADDSDEIG